MYIHTCEHQLRLIREELGLAVEPLGIYMNHQKAIIGMISISPLLIIILRELLRGPIIAPIQHESRRPEATVRVSCCRLAKRSSRRHTRLTSYR